MTDTISKEECVKRGGHFWNYYDNATPVDKYGKSTGDRFAIEPTQRYRRCALCLLTQREVHRWEDVDDE